MAKPRVVHHSLGPLFGQCWITVLMQNVLFQRCVFEQFHGLFLLIFSDCGSLFERLFGLFLITC